MQVTRVVNAVAAGRILNPKTARSQILGGVVWGIGMALEEETFLDHRLGGFMNHDLAEYHIPVCADVHEIDVLFIPEDDRQVNPLGVKGIGEIGIVGTAAAIANAVFHAIGKRPGATDHAGQVAVREGLTRMSTDHQPQDSAGPTAVPVPCPGAAFLLVAERPSVVLCDLGLPVGMNGYEVAQTFRRDATTSPARLIAISGYGQPEDQARARASGFDLHLTKPVEPDELQGWLTTS